MNLSIVVPCYNEEKNVFLIHDAICETFKNKKIDYEIIFINDGSSDSTINNLNKIINSTKVKVKVVNFSRNFGKEAAIYAGLKESVGDYVSLIDADMQQDPKYILEMYDYLNEHEEYDCVALYQKKRKERRFMSFCKKRFYKLINKMTDTKFVENASDFRLLKRNMVDAILSMKEYYRFSKGIFSWVGFNTYYMPYEVHDRASGESKWSFRKLMKYAIDGIVSFTTAPLKFATFVGLLSFIASFIYIIWVIVEKYVLNCTPPGYATVVALVLLFGGLQLFCTGIIGEYLGKLYIESKNRPIYIAKEIRKSKKYD